MAVDPAPDKVVLKDKLVAISTGAEKKTGAARARARELMGDVVDQLEHGSDADWRTVARGELMRLRNDLLLAPASPETAAVRKAVDEQLRQAARLLKAHGTPATWWTGTQVEATWDALFAARELLVYLQSPEALSAEMGYFRQLAHQSSNSAVLTKMLTESQASPPNRDVIHQLLREHHVRSSIAHTKIRKMRDQMYLLVLPLVLMLLVTVLLAGANSIYVIVGAFAGLAGTVVPLRQKPADGPYSSTLAQILIKIPLGGLTALLGILLIKSGVAGVRPAVGGNDGYYGYAVIFGAAQQLFTRLIDRNARELSDSAPAKTTTSASLTQRRET